MPNNNIKAMNRKTSHICLTCTWDKESNCGNCEIRDNLNCRWEQTKLAEFYKIILPIMLPALLIFFLLGFFYSWLPLVIYGAF